MGWRSVRLAAATAVVASMLAACAQTTRVSDDVSPAKLADAKKAVAVMRVGSASPTCLSAALLIGAREGPGFRREQVVQVAHVKSLIEPAVVEIELPPGEHHVIGYSCGQQGGKYTVVTEKASTVTLEDGRLYRTSYASFTLGAGEIVNVGYLHFGASHVGRSAFGRPLRIDVSVTDWPLDELARFKQKRPTIYQQMTTRLMKVTPRGPHEPDDDECATIKALQAEGKVQTVPASCTSAPQTPTKAPAPAARTAKAI